MIKKIVFTLLFSVSWVAGFTQNSNEELINKLVEKNVLSKEEAEELIKPEEQNKQTLSSNILKVRDSFNTPYMKFGGYGLLTYEYNELAQVHHTMKPRLIFLSMAGQLNNNFRYYILADFANPMLFELYGEWALNNTLKIRGGQFKVPFTLENQISLTDLETVSNTRTAASLAGMGYDVLVRLGASKNGAGRDIGFQASGSFFNRGNGDMVEYALGVFQGAGINLPDNNNTKDFAGSLYFKPIQGFRLGGGCYIGKANYKAEGTQEANDYKRNRWGLSMDYNKGRFYGRAEWLHGYDGDIKEEGLYGTALYYFIPKKINAAVRVDYYNENKDINSHVYDYTIAANYYFAPQCRAQLNYTFSDYSKKWTARNMSVVQAQMQIVF